MRDPVVLLNAANANTALNWYFTFQVLNTDHNQQFYCLMEINAFKGDKVERDRLRAVSEWGNCKVPHRGGEVLVRCRV